MPQSQRIFLSLVSTEFRSYRELLAKDIRRTRVEVRTQENFGNHGETTLQKIDNYIQDCHAVIHVIGDGLGFVPESPAVDALLARHPNFLSSLGAQCGLTREVLLGCSYTQWEAYLAIFHKVRLHIYRPEPSAPREPGFTPNDHDKALQLAHFNRIRALGRDRADFLNAERLSSHVLGDLHDILPPRDAAARGFAHIPRLPHLPRELIGREHWLAQLDEAWKKTQHHHLVVIKAWGGTGKTALVTTWMAEMEFKGWRDAQRVFYWSFYSQGTRREGDAVASADTFIDQALRFFGDPDPTHGSPSDRGERLARLVGQSKVLLVLDGLEPLQHPPGPMAGQLTDPAIVALFSGLAAQSAGLCLVTTREPLPDLDGRRTASTWPLDKLSDEAGAALLHHHGVQRAGAFEIDADDPELLRACVEVTGHALTLSLMGRYLALACEGDILQRDTFRLHEADPEWVITDDGSPYGHAFKVMAAYERWFADADHSRNARERAEGRVQLGILRLLGLFNRPASADCLNALLAGPVIEHLTDALQHLSPKDWKIATQRLADAGLLSIVTESRGEGIVAHALDAHPLIRDYFGQQLRTLHISSFQAAHSRLFDHLCARTPHRPDTLDGLQPLYQAVIHGCLAGRQQEACDNVYRDRILRGTGDDGFYSSKKLGAIGAELGAVAAFFEQPWTRLSPNLREAAQAWLLNAAAFFLRALGRLTEALEPMRVSGEMDAKVERWEGAAISYSNLSELEVTLGRLEPAVADARRAIDFADRLEDRFEHMAARTTAADVLHHSGQPGEQAEARALFAAAETLQMERQPQFPLLYAVQGFQYCDLILAPAERAAWRQQRSADTPVRHVEGFDSQPPIATRPPKAAETASLDQDGNGSPQSSPLESCDEADKSVRAPLEALAAAERRATQTLEWVTPQDWLLDIALDHLALARVALYRAALAPQPPAAGGNPHLAPALDGLRKAGRSDYLPKALLTAAHWQALLGDAATAERHLAEAQRIAERGPMPLYLADVHLHRARLAGMTKPEDRMTKWPGIDPRVELAKAKALIEQHGYGRRREELADAEAAAEHW